MKTFKDLPRYPEILDTLDETELIQIIKEWIREIKKLPDSGFDIHSCCGFMIPILQKRNPEYFFRNDITDWAESEGQGPNLKEVMIMLLMHIFNLTEDDLNGNT